MPSVVDLADLTGYLDDAMNALYPGDQLVYDMFNLQYNTGLRIQEIFNPTRWTNVGTINTTVQLAKREATRIIDPTLLRDRVADYLNTGVYNNLYSYSFLNWRLAGVLPIITDDTSIVRRTSHLMRYRYIRQLSADGQTDSQIQAIMGQIHLASTQGYLNRTLYLQ